MLEGVVADVLSSFLGQYVHIDRNKITLGIWSGRLEFHNLELRPESLTAPLESLGVELPWVVRAGVVGGLVVDIPWKSLGWSEPLRIVLRDVVVLVTSSAAQPDDGADRSAREAKRKRTRLAADEVIREGKLQALAIALVRGALQVAIGDEDSAAAAGEALTSAPKRGRSLRTRLFARLVDNVQVEVSNVLIRYEECTAEAMRLLERQRETPSVTHGLPAAESADTPGAAKHADDGGAVSRPDSPTPAGDASTTASAPAASSAEPPTDPFCVYAVSVYLAALSLHPCDDNWQPTRVMPSSAGSARRIAQMQALAAFYEGTPDACMARLLLQHEAQDALHRAAWDTLRGVEQTLGTHPHQLRFLLHPLHATARIELQRETEAEATADSEPLIRTRILLSDLRLQLADDQYQQLLGATVRAVDSHRWSRGSPIRDPRERWYQAIDLLFPTFLVRCKAARQRNVPAIRRRREQRRQYVDARTRLMLQRLTAAHKALMRIAPEERQATAADAQCVTDLEGELDAETVLFFRHLSDMRIERALSAAVRAHATEATAVAKSPEAEAAASPAVDAPRKRSEEHNKPAGRPEISTAAAAEPEDTWRSRLRRWIWRRLPETEAEPETTDTAMEPLRDTEEVSLDSTSRDDSSAFVDVSVSPVAAMPADASSLATESSAPDEMPTADPEALREMSAAAATATAAASTVHHTEHLSGDGLTSEHSASVPSMALPIGTTVAEHEPALAPLELALLSELLGYDYPATTLLYGGATAALPNTPRVRTPRPAATTTSTESKATAPAAVEDSGRVEVHFELDWATAELRTGADNALLARLSLRRIRADFVALKAAQFRLQLTVQDCTAVGTEDGQEREVLSWQERAGAAATSSPDEAGVLQVQVSRTVCAPAGASLRPLSPRYLQSTQVDVHGPIVRLYEGGFIAEMVHFLRPPTYTDATIKTLRRAARQQLQYLRGKLRRALSSDAYASVWSCQVHRPQLVLLWRAAEVGSTTWARRRVSSDRDTLQVMPERAENSSHRSENSVSAPLSDSSLAEHRSWHLEIARVHIERRVDPRQTAAAPASVPVARSLTVHLHDIDSSLSDAPVLAVRELSLTLNQMHLEQATGCDGSAELLRAFAENSTPFVPLMYARLQLQDWRVDLSSDNSREVRSALVAIRRAVLAARRTFFRRAQRAVGGDGDGDDVVKNTDASALPVSPAESLWLRQSLRLAHLRVSLGNGFCFVREALCGHGAPLEYWANVPSIVISAVSAIVPGTSMVSELPRCVVADVPEFRLAKNRGPETLHWSGMRLWAHAAYQTRLPSVEARVRSGVLGLSGVDACNIAQVLLGDDSGGASAPSPIPSAAASTPHALQPGIRLRLRIDDGRLQAPSDTMGWAEARCPHGLELVFMADAQRIQWMRAAVTLQAVHLYYLREDAQGVAMEVPVATFTSPHQQRGDDEFEERCRRQTEWVHAGFAADADRVIDRLPALFAQTYDGMQPVAARFAHGVDGRAFVIDAGHVAATYLHVYWRHFAPALVHYIDSFISDDVPGSDMEFRFRMHDPQVTFPRDSVSVDHEERRAPAQLCMFARGISEYERQSVAGRHSCGLSNNGVLRLPRTQAMLSDQAHCIWEPCDWELRIASDETAGGVLRYDLRNRSDIDSVLCEAEYVALWHTLTANIGEQCAWYAVSYDHARGQVLYDVHIAVQRVSALVLRGVDPGDQSAAIARFVFGDAHMSTQIFDTGLYTTLVTALSLRIEDTRPSAQRAACAWPLVTDNEREADGDDDNRTPHFSLRYTLNAEEAAHAADIAMELDDLRFLPVAQAIRSISYLASPTYEASWQWEARHWRRRRQGDDGTAASPTAASRGSKAVIRCTRPLVVFPPSAVYASAEVCESLVGHGTVVLSYFWDHAARRYHYELFIEELRFTIEPLDPAVMRGDRRSGRPETAAVDLLYPCSVQMMYVDAGYADEAPQLDLRLDSFYCRASQRDVCIVVDVLKSYAARPEEVRDLERMFLQTEMERDMEEVTVGKAEGECQVATASASSTINFERQRRVQFHLRFDSVVIMLLHEHTARVRRRRMRDRRVMALKAARRDSGMPDADAVSADSITYTPTLVLHGQTAVDGVVNASADWRLDMWADVFNDSIGAWEPLMEPYVCWTHFQLTTPGHLTVLVRSDAALNLNVAEGFWPSAGRLQVIVQEVLAGYAAAGAAPMPACQTSTTNDGSGAGPEAADGAALVRRQERAVILRKMHVKRPSLAALVVRNQTGLPMVIESERIRSRKFVLSSDTCEIHLDDIVAIPDKRRRHRQWSSPSSSSAAACPESSPTGGTGPHLGAERGHRDPRSLSRCTLHVAGFRPVHVSTSTFGIQTMALHPEAGASGERASATAASAYTLIWEMGVVDGVITGEARSVLTIVNGTGVALEVSYAVDLLAALGMQGAAAAAAGVAERASMAVIRERESWSPPLYAQLGSIRLRPLEAAEAEASPSSADAYTWSDCLPDLRSLRYLTSQAARGKLLLDRPLGKASEMTAALFSPLLTLRSSCGPSHHFHMDLVPRMSAQARISPSQKDWVELLIAAPVEVENLLPVDIVFRLLYSDQQPVCEPQRLRAGRLLPLQCVRSLHGLLLSVALRTQEDTAAAGDEDGEGESAALSWSAPVRIGPSFPCHGVLTCWQEGSAMLTDLDFEGMFAPAVRSRRTVAPRICSQRLCVYSRLWIRNRSDTELVLDVGYPPGRRPRRSGGGGVHDVGDSSSSNSNSSSSRFMLLLPRPPEVPPDAYVPVSVDAFRVAPVSDRVGTWSAPIDPGAADGLQALSLAGRSLMMYVRPAHGRFSRSLVVTFRNVLRVVNRAAIAFELVQSVSQAEPVDGGDAEAAPEMMGAVRFLRPEQCVAVHWDMQDEPKRRVIRIRPANVGGDADAERREASPPRPTASSSGARHDDSPWLWSCGIPLTVRGQYAAKLFSPGTQRQYIARLTIERHDEGTVTVHIDDEDLARPPMRLQNWSRTRSVAFRQIGASKRFWVLRPQRGTRYAWDNPFSTRKKRLLVEVEDKRFELSVDRIGECVASLPLRGGTTAAVSDDGNHTLYVAVSLDGLTRVITFYDDTATFRRWGAMAAAEASGTLDALEAQALHDDRQRGLVPVTWPRVYDAHTRAQRQLDVFVQLQQVGVSLVTAEPAELAYLFMDKLALGYTTDFAGAAIEFGIEAVRLDNQLYSSVHHQVLKVRPAVIAATNANATAAGSGRAPASQRSPGTHPAVYACVEFGPSFRGGTRNMRLAFVAVQNVAVCIDEDFLLEAWPFLRWTLSPVYFEDEPLAEEPAHRPERPADVRQQSLVYVEYLLLNPISVQLSFYTSSTGGASRTDAWTAPAAEETTGATTTTATAAPPAAASSLRSLASLLRPIKAALGTVEGATIHFRAFSLEHTLDSVQHVRDRIQDFYYAHLRGSQLRILASTGLLGNPAHLVDTLASGFADMLRTPAQATSRYDLLWRLNRAGFGLMSDSVRGLFQTVSAVSGSLSRGLAAASGDPNYIQKREERRRDAPPTIAGGLRKGLESFGYELRMGVTGIVREPYRGYREGHLWRGVGRGLAHAILRPANGILDLITHPAAGIGRHGAVNALESGERLRPPRAFGPDLRLRPYDVNDAQGSFLLWRLLARRQQQRSSSSCSGGSRAQALSVAEDYVRMFRVSGMAVMAARAARPMRLHRASAGGVRHGALLISTERVYGLLLPGGRADKFDKAWSLLWSNVVHVVISESDAHSVWMLTQALDRRRGAQPVSVVRNRLVCDSAEQRLELFGTLQATFCMVARGRTLEHEDVNAFQQQHLSGNSDDHSSSGHGSSGLSLSTSMPLPTAVGESFRSSSDSGSGWLATMSTSGADGRLAGASLKASAMIDDDRHEGARPRTPSAGPSISAPPLHREMTAATASVSTPGRDTDTSEEDEEEMVGRGAAIAPGDSFISAGGRTTSMESGSSEEAAAAALRGKRDMSESSAFAGLALSPPPSPGPASREAPAQRWLEGHLLNRAAVPLVLVWQHIDRGLFVEEPPQRLEPGAGASFLAASGEAHARQRRGGGDGGGGGVSNPGGAAVVRRARRIRGVLIYAPLLPGAGGDESVRATLPDDAESWLALEFLVGRRAAPRVSLRAPPALPTTHKVLRTGWHAVVQWEVSGGEAIAATATAAVREAEERAPSPAPAEPPTPEPPDATAAAADALRIEPEAEVCESVLTASPWPKRTPRAPMGGNDDGNTERPGESAGARPPWRQRQLSLMGYSQAAALRKSMETLFEHMPPLVAAVPTAGPSPRAAAATAATARSPRHRVSVSAVEPRWHSEFLPPLLRSYDEHLRAVAPDEEPLPSPPPPPPPPTPRTAASDERATASAPGGESFEDAVEALPEEEASVKARSFR